MAAGLRAQWVAVYVDAPDAHHVTKADGRICSKKGGSKAFGGDSFVLVSDSTGSLTMKGASTCSDVRGSCGVGAVGRTNKPGFR